MKEAQDKNLFLGVYNDLPLLRSQNSRSGYTCKAPNRTRGSQAGKYKDYLLRRDVV